MLLDPFVIGTWLSKKMKISFQIQISASKMQGKLPKVTIFSKKRVKIFISLDRGRKTQVIRISNFLHNGSQNLFCHDSANTRKRF